MQGGLFSLNFGLARRIISYVGYGYVVWTDIALFSAALAAIDRLIIEGVVRPNDPKPVPIEFRSSTAWPNALLGYRLFDRWRLDGKLETQLGAEMLKRFSELCHLADVRFVKDKKYDNWTSMLRFNAQDLIHNLPEEQWESKIGLSEVELTPVNSSKYYFLSGWGPR